MIQLKIIITDENDEQINCFRKIKSKAFSFIISLEDFNKSQSTRLFTKQWRDNKSLRGVIDSSIAAR